jgi:6-phosphogluconolactonase
MRSAILRISTALLVSLALAAIAPASAKTAPTATVYVGTYTDAESQGIYRLELNTLTGALSKPTLAAASTNPSFLVLHPNGRFVYAANEWGDGSDAPGAVSAFAIAPDGSLKLLNRQPAGGSGPCHLDLDKDGRHLLVANYGSGTAAVLPIAADGTLGDATSVVKHAGRGPRPNQEGPHAHAIVLDKDNRYAFVADLGIDTLAAYDFNATAGTLVPYKPGTLARPAGSGPRHFAFDPKGNHAYLVSEMASTVTSFDYDARRGVLTEKQTVSTLPPGFTGETDGAEIAVRPDGRFVYASNRGRDTKVMDTIAILSADPKTGALAVVGHQSTQGRTPRHFTIDPSGKFLLAANQRSHTIVVFRIDAASGKLTPVGEPVAVHSPVCLLIARQP